MLITERLLLVEKVNQDRTITDVQALENYLVSFLNRQETLTSFDISGTFHKVVEV